MIETMTAFKVEKNIPLPEPKKKPFKYPWNEMDVNDSVLIPCEQDAIKIANTIRVAAKNYGKRHSKAFTTRMTSKGLRVWRIR